MRELKGRRLLLWSTLSLALACRTPPATSPPPEEPSPLGQVAPPQSQVGSFKNSEVLTAPALRNEAWCDLVRQGRYHGEKEPPYREKLEAGCDVLHVVKAPQRDGSTMYVFFRNADPEVFPYVAPGKPLGPFSLVTSDDALVPVYAAANLLEREDSLFAYDGEGHLALALDIPSNTSHAPWMVQEIHIVPVAPEQWPVLSLQVGPPFVGFLNEVQDFTWTWQLRQPAEGGPPAIELGPRRENGRGVARVAATFHFDTQLGRYVGPDGSPGEGFLRIDGVRSDGKDEMQVMLDWAHAFLRPPASFKSPLRLRVEQQQPDGTFFAKLQWPTPADAAPALVLQLKTLCPLRSVTFHHEGWKARVTPRRLETAIPRKVLRGMTTGDEVKYELQETCGTSSGSFHVP